MKYLKQLIVALVAFTTLIAITSCGQNEQAARSIAISDVKEINVALLEYYSKQNKYPETLQQLVDENILAQEQLDLEELKLNYVAKLNNNDLEKIILYTSPLKSGDAVISRVDGSTIAIPNAELQKTISTQ